jgi:Phosphodiester glycosidase/PKD domain
MGRPFLRWTALGAALLWPAPARAEVCDALSWVSVAPGVTYHDCSDSDPAVHVVTISRSLPDYELRVLADPESQSTFHLRELDDLAGNDDALVAINGYYWEGDEGFVCGPGPLSCEGTPKTSVFLNGERRTSLSPDFFSETFLGFGRGGPRGIPISHMDGTEIDDPVNALFRESGYGAGLVVQHGFVTPPAGDEKYRQSILGYSEDKVVMLVTDGDYSIAELASTFEAFDVQYALQNDGGRSARLVINGDVDEDLKANPLPVGDREIAYGIGLVPRPRQGHCKDVRDGSDNLFGFLCVTPSSYGYDAQLTMLDDGSGRCGDFQFMLSSVDGPEVFDQGAYPACTSSPGLHSYFFETGTLGGCATLHLFQNSGDDFGRTQWFVPACPEDSDPGSVVGGITTFERGGVFYVSGPEASAGHELAWSYSVGAGTEPTATCSFGDPQALLTSFSCDRPGTYHVMLTVDGVDTFSTVVRFTNQAPSVSIRSLEPWELFEASAEIELEATIADSAYDSHTCVVDWDDGSVEELAVSDGTCALTHSYPAAGMYTIRVTATDRYGAEDTDEVMIVVQNPYGASSTSDGSLSSPPGALFAEPAAAAEAWFHLTGRFYPAQSHSPVGEARLWLAGTSFRLDSGPDALEWLVVTPDGKVAAKGTGTRPGHAGAFGFVFYAYDGCAVQSAEHCQPGGDSFRAVVWDLAAGPNPGRGLLYDNNAQAGYDVDTARPAPLQSGGVTIFPAN